MNLVKKVAWSKIIAAAVVGIAGLLTVIFAILQMTGAEVESSRPLRIVIGIVGILAGLALLIIGIIKEKDKFPVKDAASAGAAIAFGIFLFLDEADEIFAAFVGRIFPIILAGVGLAIVIKGIAMICKKNAVKEWLPVVIGGTVAFVVGLCFAIFSEQTINVTYLFLGLVIVLVAVIDIITASKVLKLAKKESK